MSENMIRDILEKRLRIKAELLIPENDTKPLTGAPFWLDEIELAYLFFEVQNQLGKPIPPESLENYAFNSIRGIAAVTQEL